MAYVVHHPYQYSHKPVLGEGENRGECAQLAQQAWARQHRPDMPKTESWIPGKRLLHCKPGELTPGTVLATFDRHGRYHNKHGYHTVLYASMTADSNGSPNTLTVIHQFKGIKDDKVRKETFHFAANKDHYKDARNYYVVESSHGASGSWPKSSHGASGNW